MSVLMSEALLNVQTNHSVKSQVKIYKKESFNFPLRTEQFKKTRHFLL